MKKYGYEVREIDALLYDDDWVWNTSYHLGDMETGAENVGRALTGWLRRRRGIVFKVNRTRILFDGDVYEIVDRKTGEPLFAAVPR